ncbi:ATP-dependent protease LonB, partial [Paenibacillus sepulcri]|nr:ATP-dependent protease LonB [Paenibacillus sepulcri]
FQAGADTVIIPRENWQAIFADLQGLQIIPVGHIDEVFRHVFRDMDKLIPAHQPTAASDVFIAPSLPYLQADSVE